jgi:hypothetical protein
MTYPAAALYPSSTLYPSGAATAPSLPQAAEALTINGVSLDSYAFMASDISGLMTVPERRGDDVVVPNRHGRIRTIGKRFDANEVVIPLWIVGADPVTGALPTVAAELNAFFARRDQLLRLLYADPMVLAYTRPDGHVVQARGEVADVLDFTRRYAAPVAQVSVAIRLLDAFWEDANSVAEVITGASGVESNLEAFQGATAPMSRLLINVAGPCNNPMLAHGDRWVRYNGVVPANRQLQLDTETWQLGPGSGGIWSFDIRNVEQGRPGPWFELDPATVPFSVVFTHTTGSPATVTISGRRAYLSA